MKAYAGAKQSDMCFEAGILPGVYDNSNQQCAKRFALSRDVSNAKHHQPSCALVIPTVNSNNLNLIHHLQKPEEKRGILGVQILKSSQ